MTNRITSLQEQLHSGEYSTDTTDNMFSFQYYKNNSIRQKYNPSSQATLSADSKSSKDCLPTCLYCSEFKKGESPANTTVLQGMWIPSAKVPVAATT